MPRFAKVPCFDRVCLLRYVVPMNCRGLFASLQSASYTGVCSLRNADNAKWSIHRRGGLCSGERLWGDPQNVIRPCKKALMMKKWSVLERCFHGLRSISEILNRANMNNICTRSSQYDNFNINSVGRCINWRFWCIGDYLFKDACGKICSQSKNNIYLPDKAVSRCK